MSSNLKKIAVVGAGGWGTALSMVLATNFDDVLLWTRNYELVKEINTSHTNEKYLPEAILNDNIHSTNEPDSLDEYQVVVNAVPTQYIRNYYKKYSLDIADKYIVNSSKGIENSSHKTISGIFKDEYSIPLEKYAVISGPSHAEEVWRNLPTTVVVGSKDIELAKTIQCYFSTDYFRVYTSKDYLGCEIGGSLKNVIAIAAGIIDGMEMGDNTKAALITRGLAELSRLGDAMGADRQTFSGLSGLGDLFVTCDSKHSRNRRFGELIGKGEKAETILENSSSIAEGVFTSQSAYELSKMLDIEMPITEQVYMIIFEGKEPKKAISDLMKRDSKHERY